MRLDLVHTLVIKLYIFMKMSYSCHVLVMFDVMPRSKTVFRLMLSKSYANSCDTYLVRPLFQCKFTIYLNWFRLCCKFTYMYIDYFASSHLWHSCWLFCKFTPMMFIFTMPKMPSLHLCCVYEFPYAYLCALN